MSMMDALGVVPKLDYLIGYVVKNVLVKDDGSGYVIEFENGALVSDERTNEERESSEYPAVEGLALISTILSTGETRLRFGIATTGSDGAPFIEREITVSFDPTRYTITDPRFESGTVYPQQTDPQERPLSIREQFEAQAALQNPPEEAQDGSGDAEKPDTATDEG